MFIGKNRRKAEDRFTTRTRSTRGDKNQRGRVSLRTFYGFSKRCFLVWCFLRSKDQEKMRQKAEDRLF